MNFRIEVRYDHGPVVAVFGPIPVDAMSATVDIAEAISGGDAIFIDGTLSNQWGATAVMGTAEALQAWRDARADAAPVTAWPALTRWVHGGEHGMSAMTIYRHLRADAMPVVAYSDGRDTHPWDPDDLRRCMLLVEAADADGLGWSARIGEMAKVSQVWAGLSAQWVELVATLRDEIGGAREWRAPRTYAAMRAIIDGEGDE